ncbi:MAG: hypothetical protein ACJZ36_03040 [Candidatus Pelagibacter sp.]
MIYTYYFTNKFLEDMRNNINSEEILDVIDFIKINFQSKENLHYCGSENIFHKNFGINGNNSDTLDHFINKFHQQSAISIFSNKENEADIVFCGIDENIKKEIFKYNCHTILNKSNELIKEIENETHDGWINDDGKEDLNKKLTQLLRFSKSIIFIDRHIPKCTADNDFTQMKQWRYSLEYFNSLISNHKKIKTFFINGVNNYIFGKYSQKIQKSNSEDIIELIQKFEDLKQNKFKAAKDKKAFNQHLEIVECEKKIEFKGKELLKEDLKKFFSPLSDIKTNIMIKDKQSWRELHDRYIFFFLEEFDVDNDKLEEFVTNKNLIIFEVSEGLNILDVKKKTTSNRKIIRQKNKDCVKISKKWDKNVSKLPYFYKFVAVEEKKAS